MENSFTIFDETVSNCSIFMRFSGAYPLGMKTAEEHVIVDVIELYPTTGFTTLTIYEFQRCNLAPNS